VPPLVLFFSTNYITSFEVTMIQLCEKYRTLSTPVHTTPDNAMRHLFYLPIIPPVKIVEYDRGDRCRMGVVPASS